MVRELKHLLAKLVDQNDPLFDPLITLIFEQQARLSEQQINDDLLKELVQQLVESERQLHQSQRALLEANERLEMQNAALIEADRLKQDVERIVRHDLKSPMNAVVGYAELLLDDHTLSTEQKKTIKTIRNGGRNALHMINLSLGLYRMEQGVYQLTPEKIDLLDIIRQIKVDSRTLLLNNQNTLVLQIDGQPILDGALFEVWGEKILCYSMLANLIKNALEASPVGKKVTVALSSVDPFGLILIHNWGVPPLKVRERFFEKYATAGKTSGTGLGTYSAKMIAETHGGGICMRCEEDLGTTITVALPLKAGLLDIEKIDFEQNSETPVIEIEASIDDDPDDDLTEESVAEIEAKFLSEAITQRQFLQEAIQNQDVDQALERLAWFRWSSAETGVTAPVLSQSLRVTGEVEMEDWERAFKAYQRLAEMVEKALNDLS
ncbi:sensor histidine kinase [Magnetococcales bacterium HHB-1]